MNLLKQQKLKKLQLFLKRAGTKEVLYEASGNKEAGIFSFPSFWDRSKPDSYITMKTLAKNSFYYHIYNSNDQHHGAVEKFNGNIKLFDNLTKNGRFILTVSFFKDEVTVKVVRMN